MQPVDDRHALLDRAPRWSCAKYPIEPRAPTSPRRESSPRISAVSRSRSGRRRFASSAFSSVVLPCPLRPINAIFSPRCTLAVKSVDHVLVAIVVTSSRPRTPATCLPEGRFMLELDERPRNVRSRQLTGSQALHFLLAATSPGSTRVPAEKRAINSFSCAIFFSRCAFWLSICARICVFCQHHVVVAAGVGDDRFVIDVGDMRANAVQEMPIVRNHDQQRRRNRSRNSCSQWIESRSR